MSGVVTDELREILRASGQEVGTEPVELLPGVRPGRGAERVPPAEPQH